MTQVTPPLHPRRPSPHNPLPRRLHPRRPNRLRPLSSRPIRQPSLRGQHRRHARLSQRIPLRNRPRHPTPQQTQDNLRPRIRPKAPLTPYIPVGAVREPPSLCSAPSPPLADQGTLQMWTSASPVISALIIAIPALSIVIPAEAGIQGRAGSYPLSLDEPFT